MSLTFLEQVGARLAAERKRLGYRRQDDFAEKMRMPARTYWDREKGNVSPDAEFFARFCELGGDAMYVISGVSSGEISLMEPNAGEYRPARRLANQIASLPLTEDDAALIMTIANRLSSKIE